MPVDTTFYDLLDVSPTSTFPEIRKAFRLKALHLHPDRNRSPTATHAFQHLKAVYDILSDADKRAEYDQFGPPKNLHGDDDDFDMDSVAAFFQRKKKVTKEDIKEYEKVYRAGKDEMEDLIDFYARMKGRVTDVDAYIPYSDQSDFVRFVSAWDDALEKGELERFPDYKKARKALLRKGKGKERDLNAEITAQNEEETGNDNAAKKKRASKKKDDGGMDQLQLLIAQRQQDSKAKFDQWCEEVEARETKKPKKQKLATTGRAGGRKRKTRSASDLQPRGNIRKQKS